jgi:hypothetical protein
MQRAAWAVLLGVACVGCGKKEQPELPHVELDPNPPALQPVPPSKVAALDYGKLWDPAGSGKANHEAVVKEMAAEQYFAQHYPAYLTGATVGALVSATPGDLHRFLAPSVLGTTYPEVAKKMAGSWQDRLMAPATAGMPALDFSTFAPGGASVRVLVFRVRGSSDELSAHFEGYLPRLDRAVRGTGALITDHRRGGARTFAAPLSELRYQTPTGTGSIRSLIVNRYHPTDHELVTVVLGDMSAKADGDLFATMMPEEGGPFLVIARKEQSR